MSKWGQTQHAVGRVGSVLAIALPALAALLVLAAYLPRLAFDLPLYGGDEGAYLIRALFGPLLEAHPALAPQVAEIDNTVFLAILRGLGHLTPSVLEVARVLGTLAYFGGLALTYRAVRVDLTPQDRWAFLLLALIFPYHRFVVTALPEGWYVGLLGLIIWVTARFWRTRPLSHAALTGLLAAGLVLIKPHGAAVVAAVAALIVADGLVDGRLHLKQLASRLSIFLAAFLLLGNLVANLDGKPPANALFFFGNGFYADTLSAKAGVEAIRSGLKALTVSIATVALLAGVPILAGVADIGRRRWRERSQFRLAGADLAFLLTLFALLATVAMVGLFAVKALALGPAETGRLWGRYFEFFVPLIWLTAAPAIQRWDQVRLARNVAADVMALGLALLIVCLLTGVMVFPWDSTAMSAFYRPSMERWPFNFTPPIFMLSVAASLLTIRLMLTAIPTVRVWQGYFAALALLSSVFDEAWVRDIMPARQVLGLEIGGARLLARDKPGPVVAYFDDANSANCLFLRLEGRPTMKLVAPGLPVDTAQLGTVETVIVQGDHAMPATGWKAVQPGALIKVYQRAP
ncbi:hypothetical protein [Phenylobacterium sp.]|uniref:hypothetical protein n=1 Tax=Phenylobacterium sp. TaxID=1871053 RepID=UPI0030F3E7BE